MPKIYLVRTTNEIHSLHPKTSLIFLFLQKVEMCKASGRGQVVTPNTKRGFLKGIKDNTRVCCRYKVGSMFGRGHKHQLRFILEHVPHWLQTVVHHALTKELPLLQFVLAGLAF